MTQDVQQKNAPNAIASLVLGILSILTGCFFAGLILGIIGLILASNAKKALLKSPELYTGEGLINAGRICSIIGVVLGGISSLYYIVALLFLGGAASISSLYGMFG